MDRLERISEKFLRHVGGLGIRWRNGVERLALSHRTAWHGWSLGDEQLLIGNIMDTAMPEDNYPLGAQGAQPHIVDRT